MVMGTYSGMIGALIVLNAVGVVLVDRNLVRSWNYLGWIMNIELMFYITVIYSDSRRMSDLLFRIKMD